MFDEFNELLNNSDIDEALRKLGVHYFLQLNL